MNKPSPLLKDIAVVVVTHRSVMPCIPGDDLKKFLLGQGVSQLLYITHPLLLLEESKKLSSQFEFFRKPGHSAKIVTAHHFVLPETLSYLKDLVLTIYWALGTKQTFDLYFGMNNINALAGLVLKLLGRVDKVIYYTIDLYPQRFKNRLINWIYHKLDRFCVKFADETWNVSPFSVEYRKVKTSQYTVPIGIWFDEMKRTPFIKVDPNKIVYVGHLKDFYGVDLPIKALPLLRKKYPNIRLEIIGGGEQLSELEQLVNKLKVQSNIKFHGWQDKKTAEAIMSNAALGLAPFNNLLLNKKKNKQVGDLIKNGDPAKIKDYLALGLPVVMTAASMTAKTIEQAGCAIIIEYTPKSLATAVLKLLSSKKLQQQYRKNALTYVEQFDWNLIFSKNLTRIING